VKTFRRQGLKCPRCGEDGRGEIVWQELTLGLALHVLHNPRYAGVFSYGRRRLWKDIDGKHRSHNLPREEWRFVKQNAPDYVCFRVCSETAGPSCQRIPGAGVDEEIGRLLVQSVTPLALEVALNVQKEIQARRSESHRLREQQVQRA
jgi:hypothetical protein